MKVELIHRIDADGEWFVVRKIKGEYVNAKVFMGNAKGKEDAEAYYDALLTITPIETILKSTEI